MAKAEADVRATLAGYAIADRATLRGLHQSLLAAAMFRRDSPAVAREVAIVRDLSDKPLGRATAGDWELAYARAAATAKSGSPGFAAAFRRAYEAGLAPLPWSLYGDAAREKLGQNALLSRAGLVGGFAPLYQPQVDRGGKLDEAGVRALIRAAVLMRDGVPIKAELLAADRAYIRANRTATADIWAEHDAVLPTDATPSPVVVAVWDSGTDASVFPGRLWINGRERPNGRDDDGNGYADDLHGVAVD